MAWSLCIIYHRNPITASKYHIWWHPFKPLLSEVIQRYGSWWTSVLLMACCLMTPSCYLNQCWQVFKKIIANTFQYNRKCLWRRLSKYMYKYNVYVLKHPFSRDWWISKNGTYSPSKSNRVTQICIVFAPTQINSSWNPFSMKTFFFQTQIFPL